MSTGESTRASSRCGCCRGVPLLVFPAAFYGMMVTGGVLYALGGLYYVSFKEEFGQSNALTSYVGSVSHACLAVSGPLCSFMCDKFGTRVTVCVGSVVATLGLIIGSFSNTFPLLLASAGVIFGLGLGIMYMGGIVVVNLTYKRARVLLNGVLMAGVGVGSAVYTPLFNILLPEFGWRGTMLLTAGITLNTVVAGACMSPNLCTFGSTDDATLPIKSKKNTELGVAEGSIKDVLRTLLRDRKYIAVYLSAVFYWFTMSAILTHATPLAISHGQSLERGTSLMSVFGVGTLGGRLVLGFIGQHPSVDNIALCAACFIMSGGAAIGFTLSREYVWLVTSMAVFGATSAAHGPSFTETTIQVVGTRRFSQAYGWLGLPMAVGMLFGAPAAGWVYDMTGVYSNAFYLPGLAALASGLCLLFPCISLRLAKKQQATNLSKCITTKLDVIQSPEKDQTRL